MLDCAKKIFYVHLKRIKISLIYHYQAVTVQYAQKSVVAVDVLGVEKMISSYGRLLGF